MTASDPLDFTALRATLYTAVVADVLDALGLRSQAVDLPLVPISGEGLLLGRAKTTQWEDVDEDPRPYELELQAVDNCQHDDVLIAAAGGSMRSGIWGELLSTAARHRGCAGVVVDGAVRDVARMRHLGFHVIARGTSPLDSLHRQRVTAVDVPIELGGVRIEPGDLVLADLDGVVVVPQAVEAAAIAGAIEKTTAENKVRDEIRAGAKAGEVFQKYGVL
ncbi:MAG: RraA family protein [Planctomycetota bacterium]|nr:MAG: RraA family protein [Planctomycetota bacterium]